MDQIQDQEPVSQQTITLPDNAHHRQLPPPEKCPRCNSPDIKFRYFNNHNLLQPRYLCKSCDRYWTHGGVQRNVPIGGGCRKNKRPKFQGSSGSIGEIVPRSQHIPDVHFTGLDLELRLGFNMGTNNNNNNTNSLYTGGATLSVMQGINKPQVGRFGGNVAL